MTEAAWKIPVPERVVGWWPIYHRGLQLSVPAALEVGARWIVPANFTMSVPASVGMVGHGISKSTITLPAPVQLAFAPPAPIPTAAVIPASVTFLFVGAERVPGSFGLSTPSTIAVSGRPIAAGTIGLSVPATLAVSGTAKYPGPVLKAVANNAIPATTPGDIIIVFAYIYPPTVPAPPGVVTGTIPLWNVLAQGGGFCLAFAIATGTNHTLGTWTSTYEYAVAVLSGQNVDVPLGALASASGNPMTSPAPGDPSGAFITAPAVTMMDASGGSQLLHFFGMPSNSYLVWGSLPAGYTRQGSATYTSIVTPNDPTADGAVSISCTTLTLNQSMNSATVEILGPTLPPPRWPYSDNFSRVDNAAGLGPYWTPQALTMGVRSGQAYAVDPSGHCVATFIAPAPVDNVKVQANIYNTITNAQHLWMASGPDVCVGVFVLPGAISIRTGTGVAGAWPASYTSRVSAATTVNSGDLISIERQPNSTVFVARQNGIKICTWDGAGVVPVDPSHRLVGLGGYGGFPTNWDNWACGEAQVDLENVNISNAPVPPGATGCYVTLIGAGGSGGAGYYLGGNNWNYGGGGGGGGGRIPRVFIPVASLGATYSVTQGLAAAGAVGGASTFTSGSVSLSAGGGWPGGDAPANGTAPIGTGGTCSVVGLSGVTTYGGANGSAYNSPGGNAPNSGAGGGGGGLMAGASLYLGYTSPGGNTGAAPSLALGGAKAASVAGTPGNPGGNQNPQVAGGAGGGGGEGTVNAPMTPGGAGGLYGGGGGGSSPVGNAGATPVRTKGGDGYSNVEWVY